MSAPSRAASETRTPCRLAALGVTSALGRGVEETRAGLVAGEVRGARRREDLVPGRAMWCYEAPRPLPEIPPALARWTCTNNALSLDALSQIEAPLRETIARLGPERVAVVMGTSTSGVARAEDALRHRAQHGELPAWFHYEQLELGGTAGFVREALGLRGPALVLSTACSSGARALATARSLLRLGLADAVVAGATDTLCGLTANGFASLQAISDALPNPMSRNRSGLVLGEASAIFLVTREPGGVQLTGVGDASDAHHMSAPDPEGRGAETALREALADAGVEASEVAYLNLHGTATPLNDPMEAAAVMRVLGDRVPCSSTKPLVGHTLGAAGALEAAFCWIVLDAMRDGVLALPPHLDDGVRDPEIAPIRLVAKGETVRAGRRAVVVTSSFGFGGNDCVLVLEREP